MFSDQPIERYNPVGDADVEHREEFRKRLDFWSHELLRASQDKAPDPTEIAIPPAPSPTA